jgi:uncharacterized protein (DUF1810 family)
MSKEYSSERQADDFNLVHFIEAQELVYPRVTNELKNGKKQSHWMWFIFPQVIGLGISSISNLYSIKSIEEAKAYLNHPVLGKRLIECSAILLDIKDKSANEIFGFPDNVKLQSCMTLFSTVSSKEPVFDKILAKYFKNVKDQRTIEILNTL